MITPVASGRQLSTKLEIFDLELAHDTEFGRAGGNRLAVMFAGLRSDLLRLGVDDL